MNNRTDGVVNFLFGKELMELNEESRESNPNKTNQVSDVVKPIGELRLPNRWKGTAKAMANFKELGMAKDAAKLHRFMASEIRKQSRSTEDYEHLYNMWSTAVSDYTRFGIDRSCD